MNFPADRSREAPRVPHASSAFHTDASAILASTSASKGFLDWACGRNATEDPVNSRVSYEKPSLAVNKNGDMLLAYGRYPFSPANSLNPEARYTVWYANEAQQRRSRQFRVHRVVTR